MDTRNKCCGNCKHFKDEDIEGFSYCEIEHGFKYCDEVCVEHEAINNGWTEITPDNEHELADKLMTRTIIGHIGCDGRMYTTTLHNCHLGIGTMAKYGGYYYYVLPELKIE
jgi:hypothetical protein